MDIITHAAAGIVLGSPLIVEKPAVSVCFAVGAVLPDLDAFARLFGKLTFMKQHRTFSHSIAGTLVCALVLPTLCFGQFQLENSLALALGMAGHLLFDWINLYGLMLLYPFSKKRYCRHYFFFFDAPIFAMSLLALSATIYALYFQPEFTLLLWIALGYCMAMAIMITWRIVLYYQGMKLFVGEKVVLIPDAFWPWKFIGIVDRGDVAVPIVVNALTQSIKRGEPIAILDLEYSDLLEKQPEYQAMRDLMPMYRCVQCILGEDRMTLVCRELAIRNFGGLFGTLEINYDPNTKTLVKKVFHV